MLIDRPVMQGGAGYAPLGAAEFERLMAVLGPWPACRRIAVAVSGGADSLCLAWLARTWGDPLALIVDHGLRPDSAAEAREAASRLAAFGVSARILSVRGLSHGPGLAERARRARYAALASASAESGLSDLLLAHHAGDQAETLLIRTESGSGESGLACMSAVTDLSSLRLVRPLLGTPPDRLRATLHAQKIGWAEDPSNRNPAYARTRARRFLQDRDCTETATATLLTRSRAHGGTRVAAELRVSATLAARVSIFPQGYATLTPGSFDPESLAALIRMIGGAPYAPSLPAVAGMIAGGLRGTLGGVRLMGAGRLAQGTLVVRESAAMQPPVPAQNGCLWDRRFRLDMPFAAPEGTTIGALGEAASRFRKSSRLSSAILATLPAVRDSHGLVAVPHLGYFIGWTNPQLRLRLTPASPAAGAGFLVCTMGDAQPAGEHHVPVHAAAHP